MKAIKRGILASFSIILLFGVLAFNVQAGTLLTSDVGYTGPTLDLTAYQTGAYNFTFGPESIPGGITFTASPGGSGGYPFGGNSGNGSVLGQGSYGLASNGSFGGDAVYAGVDSGTGNMTFSLSSPVSEFGLYLNYAPGFGNPPTIETLDDVGNPLSIFDLSIAAPISTPGGFNEFMFRGIDEGNDSIWGLRLGGSYLLAAATATGAPVDPIQPIPEPSTFLLLGGGLAGLAFYARRRKKE